MSCDSYMSYHWLLRSESHDMFLICRDDTVSPAKRGTVVLHVWFFLGWGMWGVVVVICSDSLAGDAPSWWKPQNLFCSQVFDHIQKVWVLVSGPHCLDNFCRVRVTMVINEGANSSMNRRVFVVGVWSKSLSSKSPSTFILICCSSAASRCRASCDTLGAPGKQIMMMLMLSKLPCRDGQNHHETDPGGR